jgi:hypothetical protein
VDVVADEQRTMAVFHEVTWLEAFVTPGTRTPVLGFEWGKR